MQQKFAVLFISVFLLVSCAAPTPQATITPQTSEVSETSEVLTSTPTQTPASTPTSTFTPEPTLPTYDIELASMDQFERQTYWEQGTVIAVEDLYGAGPATISIEQVEEAKPGQVLDYQQLDYLDQQSGDFGGITINRITLMNLTLEAKSLVRVDIGDNSQIADGEWCVMRLGTLVNGAHTSFEVVVSGNITDNTTGRSICEDWKVGDIVDALGLSFFPQGNVSIDHIREHMLVGGLDEQGISIRLFELLGEGSEPLNRRDILDLVKEGGILDKSQVRVGYVW